jgi:hypothetical protein
MPITVTLSQNRNAPGCVSAAGTRSVDMLMIQRKVDRKPRGVVQRIEARLQGDDNLPVPITVAHDQGNIRINARALWLRCCQRQLRTDPGKLLISNSELTHLDGIRG